MADFCTEFAHNYWHTGDQALEVIKLHEKALLLSLCRTNNQTKLDQNQNQAKTTPTLKQVS